MGKILVLGSGAREHALALKLSQSRFHEKLYVAPGNDGMKDVAEIVPSIKVNDFEAIENFVRTNDIDLTVVGPEDPLCNGIVDHFYHSGLVAGDHFIFGPTKAAARLEGSKAFAKEFMSHYGIPTANFKIFDDFKEAYEHVKYDRPFPLVVKASGLAAGKGSIVCKSLDESLDAIGRIMVKKEFGKAGERIVIEDFMEGEEASILLITDGNNCGKVLASSQDHKRAYDNDLGPNTGGMGAYAPAPIVTDEVMTKVVRNILAPTIRGMRQEGTPFTGCLYVGLMIDKQGNPRVVEYNVRFGDPETQVVLPILKTDLYSVLFECARGTFERAPLIENEGSACCVVLASGGYPGDYKKGKLITGLDIKIPDTIIFHAGTKLENGKYVTNGGRVLGVTGLGDNLTEAIANAYNGVGSIKWDEMHYRDDIGQKGLKR